MIPVACGQEVVTCGFSYSFQMWQLQVGGTKDAILTNLFLLIPIVLCFLFFYVSNLIELYNFLRALSANGLFMLAFNSSLNRKRHPQIMRKRRMQKKRRMRGKNWRKCVKSLMFLKMVALAKTSEEVHFHSLWF